VANQRRETLRTDRAFVNIRVTVPVAAEFDLRVVQMEATQSRNSDAIVYFFHERVRARNGRVVDTTGPKVLSVDTDAEALVTAARVD
jgi:hypothetical protein